MEQEQENSFTVLENKTIGRNLSLYRKIRGIKAADMAERLGLKESSYTRYERGETALTIDFVQKASEVLKIDPLTMLSISPGSYLENGSNSPNSCIANQNGYYNYQGVTEDQTKMILKLMENVTTMSERVLAMLEKGK